MDQYSAWVCAELEKEHVVKNVKKKQVSTSSGVSLPTGQWSNSKAVIQISVASTAPELRQIFPYFFNVIGLDEVVGIKPAEFALESEAQTYASLVVGNPFGLGIETWAERPSKWPAIPIRMKLPRHCTKSVQSTMVRQEISLSIGTGMQVIEYYQRMVYQ